MAGKDPASFQAFRDLVQLLLSHTIIPSHVAVRLTKGVRADAYVIAGYQGPTDPIELNDGRYLRITMRLFLQRTKDGDRVKVESSNFQYQTDKAGDRWICRYDYNRNAPGQYPSTHFHVRGTLMETCLGDDETLERIHFPTNRVSLEAIIRLLIEQFNVQPNTDAQIWRQLLAETEGLFMHIAHKSLSGPST